MNCTTALDFGTLVKSPSEKLLITFNFSNQCFKFWSGGAFYSAGDVVRPSYSTGFVYKALTNATSAAKEPKWMKTQNSQTSDGSQKWLAEVATNQAADLILAAAVEASTGIQAVIKNWNFVTANVEVQGGSDEAEYKVQCSVTLESGQILSGILRVEVDD